MTKSKILIVSGSFLNCISSSIRGAQRNSFVRADGESHITQIEHSVATGASGCNRAHIKNKIDFSVETAARTGVGSNRKIK